MINATEATGNTDWKSLGGLKDYYGGNWYDFGAKEGQPGWYRAPRINPSSAEAVWNPQYGWQDWNKIQGMTDYSNLTPQFGDVYQLYGGYNTNSPKTGTAVDQAALAGTSYTPNANAQGSGWQSGGGYNLTPEQIESIRTGFYDQPARDVPFYGGNQPLPEYTGFQYPSQWGTASDVLTGFAGGMPTPIPNQWQTATDTASQMAQSGLPVDITGYAQAQIPAMQNIYKQMADQAIESAGLQGLRQSSPLGYQLGDLSRQMTENYMADIAGKQLSADEAARARQLQGTGYLQSLGSGYAGLSESAKDRAMQAAGMLPGLGAQYLQAPQDWASRMWGMGTQEQQLNQSALDRAFQEFLRMSPENSQWLAQAMGYAGMNPAVAQQQYTQNPLFSLLQSLISAGGFAAGAAL